MLSQTQPSSVPLVPEITLHLATEITPIWQATEAWCHTNNAEPPFWAFAWPGGQALARHLLDRPATVTGRRILDFAAGCGIAAIAAMRAGAARQPRLPKSSHWLATALTLNAAANGTQLVIPHQQRGRLSPARWDLILCGDVCYEAPMTSHILPCKLRHMARTGRRRWIADPGRAYLPRDGLTAFATCVVPTSLELEDRTEREVTLYRFGPRMSWTWRLRLAVAPAASQRRHVTIPFTVSFGPSLAISHTSLSPSGFASPRITDQHRQRLLQVGILPRLRCPVHQSRSLSHAHRPPTSRVRSR